MRSAACYLYSPGQPLCAITYLNSFGPSLLIAMSASAKVLARITAETLLSASNVSANNMSTSLSQQSSVAHVLAAVWAPATTVKYSAAVLRFMSYCTKEHVPTCARLPASEQLLCAFAASMAGTKSASTIRSDLAGIRGWHILNCASWNGSVSLSYVLKGCEHLAPSGSRLLPRPPVTLQMLEHLESDLDSSSPMDAAVLFTATVAFYGQLRLGEILPANERRDTGHGVPTVADLGPRNLSGSHTLHLPRTKTHQSAGENVTICHQLGNTDPIAALDFHLAANHPDAEDSNILCSYLTSTGSRKLLTRRVFMKRCNAIWRRRGLPLSTGHEFRIGGTTHYLLCRVPPDVIKALGRWSSDAFLRYWRSLELLAPMYIGGAVLDRPAWHSHA